MSNICGWDALEWSDGSVYLVVERGIILERLRISRISRMVDREGDGAAEGAGGD